MGKSLKSYVEEIKNSKVVIKETTTNKTKKTVTKVVEQSMPAVQLLNPKHMVKIEKAYGYIGKPDKIANQAFVSMAKLPQPIQYKIDDLTVQADINKDPYTWTNQDGNVIKINYLSDLENFIPDWWDLVFRTNWQGPMPSQITSIAPKNQTPTIETPKIEALKMPTMETKHKPEFVMYKGNKCQVVKFTRGPMVGIMVNKKLKMVKKDQTSPCESEKVDEQNESIGRLKKLSGIKNG